MGWTVPGSKILVALPKEQIAAICHAANRAYCQQLGDSSQPIWECISKETQLSTVQGVEAILAKPDLTPEQSHEAWAKFKIEHGWKYGEKKNDHRKEHPCLVPYYKLPEHQRLKDILFGAVVRAFMVREA